MRFHPVISIFIGVIVSFLLHLVTQSLFVYGWISIFYSTFSYIFGGFIAVFYAREKKIQYGLYEGILIILILNLLAFIASSNVYTISILYYGIFVILLAILGGIIALITDKKNYNGFSPLLAIIGGSVIGYSCIILLTSIINFNPHPNDSLQVSFFL